MDRRSSEGGTGERVTLRPSGGLAEVGKPELVCRWRLADGALPLANRHLRALRARELGGQPMPAPLVAWAKEHIDWTLGDSAGEHPDGVLMLVVDARFHAAMAVGPYRPPASTALRSLLRRAHTSQREAERTGVAPETLWVARSDGLEWFDDRANVASGTATLVRDLARTLGLGVHRSDVSIDLGKALARSNDAAFLVSDEHGVVVPNDRQNETALRFAAGYQRLLESTMRRKSHRDEARHHTT